MNEQTTAGGNDERYKLAYQESLRSLDQQSGVLADLRSRAGALLGATSLATAFLGVDLVQAPQEHGWIVWVVLACAGLSAAAAISVLWPTPGWVFRSGAQSIVGTIDQEQPTIVHLHKHLAKKNDQHYKKNDTKLKRNLNLYRVGLFLLVAEIGLALVCIALRS